MCGRFTLTVNPADLQNAFPEFTFPGQFAPHFNVAPTQPVLVLPNDGTGKADFFVWGLIPSWATPALAGGAREDPSIGARMITPALRRWPKNRPFAPPSVIAAA